MAQEINVNYIKNINKNHALLLNFDHAYVSYFRQKPI